MGEIKLKEENNNSIYNEDELHAPDFLNEEFFLDILKKEENNNAIKILKLDLSPGTTKADHYASIMFRAKVRFTRDGKENFRSMIIKTVPFVESQKKDLLENFKLFDTEILMYSEALPKMEKVLRQHGDETRLCAKILFHSLKPNPCIVFDDLTLQGFTTISGRWPTMEEVKAALTKLAKLHAVSHKLAHEGDKSFTLFTEGSFCNDKILDFPFVAQAASLFKDALAKHDDLKEYIPRIEAIEENLLTRIIQSFRAHANGKRDGIFVLNHGDFHMKNMMIRKGKSNNLEDLMLVDYQISFFGSPALDLIYSYYMLFSPEMREKHRDELFYFYFKTFQDTLRLTGYKGRIPTVVEFQYELLKHSHWDLFLFMSFLMFSYIFSDENGDLGEAVENEDVRRCTLQRPEMLAEIRRHLPIFLHRGYFE